MAKITLNIKKKDENGKKFVQAEEFIIDRVSTLAMFTVKKELTNILKDIKGNGDLVTVVNDFLNGETKPGEEPKKKLDIQNIQASDLEGLKDERFVNTMAGALELLLEKMPERAFTLLSVLSEIDEETLKNTYFDELFDVYDAVMAENDISKMVDRLKKSFSGTKGNWKQALQTFLAKK
jgi:hypothetical protein